MTTDERLAAIEKRIVDLPEGRPIFKDGEIVACPSGKVLLGVDLTQTYGLKIDPRYLDAILNVKQDQIYLLNVIRDLQGKLKDAAPVHNQD